MARPVWECVGTGMSVAPAMGNTGITPRRASLGHPLTTARPPRRRSSGGEGGEADRTSRDTCTPIRRPASAACRRHRCFSRHGRHGGGQRHRGFHKNRRCRLRPVAWAGGRRLVGSGTGGSGHRAGPHLHQTQTADGTSPRPRPGRTRRCARRIKKLAGTPARELRLGRRLLRRDRSLAFRLIRRIGVPSRRQSIRHRSAPSACPRPQRSIPTDAAASSAFSFLCCPALPSPAVPGCRHAVASDMAWPSEQSLM